MALAKIKDAYKKTVIAFGRNGLPLGKRSQEEINELAIIAQGSGNKKLLEMFETLPNESDLKSQKVEVLLADIRPGLNKTITNIKSPVTSDIVPIDQSDFELSTKTDKKKSNKE